MVEIFFNFAIERIISARAQFNFCAEFLTAFPCLASLQKFVKGKSDAATGSSIA